MARTNLALLRRWRHWTQGDLARSITDASTDVLPKVTSVSVRQINRWESDDPPLPHPAHQRVLEQLFAPLTFHDIWYAEPATVHARITSLNGHPGPPAEQLVNDPSELTAARLLRPHRVLLAAMIEVVTAARDILVVTGSRSRDATYLQTIEQMVETHQSLVHYRILYGPPRHTVLVEHL